MNSIKKAYFGGGCFWCTEAVFQSLKGVITVVSGYAGAGDKAPTYEQVSGGNTGFVESIQIEFDPTLISYDDLLAVFFNTHDPTTVNQQGADIGTQYRSVVFYTDNEQKEKAQALIKELNVQKAYDKPVVTEVVPLVKFYEAEKYHQNYYKNNPDTPYCQIVIAPKLEKLQKRFKELLA